MSSARFPRHASIMDWPFPELCSWEDCGLTHFRWNDRQGGGFSRFGTKIFGGGLGAAADMELSVDVHQVGADRRIADGQARRDLLVRAALGHERQDFQFPRRQLVR